MESKQGALDAFVGKWQVTSTENMKEMLKSFGTHPHSLPFLLHIFYQYVKTYWTFLRFANCRSVGLFCFFGI